MALLSIENLSVSFYTRQGAVRAVQNLTVAVDKGETLALVGESGSGKSVSMLSIMGLIPKPPGKIDGGRALFNGRDLMGVSPSELRSIIGSKIAMIFRDPMTSLNPFMRIEKQLTEAQILHKGRSHKVARRRAIEALEFVGISNAASRIDSYPHEFSGGMRQRVMIAMALVVEPELLIADEPTTALDVTVQAQILDLLKSLQKTTGLGLILITHDLGVVAGMSDRIAVMYAGRCVEQGTADEVFYHHKHPYTRGLLKSVLHSHAPLDQSIYCIPGSPPDLARLGNGCSFAARCEYAKPECQSHRVEEILFSDTQRYSCVMENQPW